MFLSIFHKWYALNNEVDNFIADELKIGQSYKNGDRLISSSPSNL